MTIGQVKYTLHTHDYKSSTVPTGLCTIFMLSNALLKTTQVAKFQATKVTLSVGGLAQISENFLPSKSANTIIPTVSSSCASDSLATTSIWYDHHQLSKTNLNLLTNLNKHQKTERLNRTFAVETAVIYQNCD